MKKRLNLNLWLGSLLDYSSACVFSFLFLLLCQCSYSFDHRHSFYWGSRFIKLCWALVSFGHLRSILYHYYLKTNVNGPFIFSNRYCDRFWCRIRCRSRVTKSTSTSDQLSHWLDIEFYPKVDVSMVTHLSYRILYHIRPQCCVKKVRNFES